MRIIAPALVAASLVALVGCGSDPSSRPSPTPAATQSPPLPTLSGTPAPTASPGFPLVLATGCGPTRIPMLGDAADCPPGLLVRSDDGGRTWSQRRFEHAFDDLSFADRHTGWATAFDDVLQTVDGGETWTSRRTSLPTIADGSCNDRYGGVAFLDAQTGVIVGLVHCGVTIADSFVLHTNDGGRTWRTAFVGPGAWYGGLRRACFTATGIGLAAGAEIALVSPDRGETWTRAEGMDGGPLSGTSVACAGDRDLWLLDDLYPAVHHSADGGVSWVDLAESMPSGPNGLPATIGFFDARLGWIAGGQDTLVLTRDGGSSWQVKALVDGPVPFEHAAFLDRLHGLALTWAVAALTDDGGESWRLVAVTPGELSRFFDVEVVR